MWLDSLRCEGEEGLDEMETDEDHQGGEKLRNTGETDQKLHGNDLNGIFLPVTVC
jgi:hypothetical protein